MIVVKCVVIADDLTGANATGVLLKKQRYDTSTIMNIVKSDLHRLDPCECVTFTTDSRGVDADIAYNRVFNITKMFEQEDITFFTKRVDSTLRGNLGSETDGMLDALGEAYTAVVVPCAPASGRVTVGGYMLVNGIMLHKTEAALDPKTPITVSRVEVLFKQQTRYEVESVYMKDINAGKQQLIRQIRQLVKSGKRILIFDSITQEDIDLISDAVIESGIQFIAVDPGAFTATLAQKLIVPRGNEKTKRILAVVGSVNPVTKTQMETFWLAQTVFNVFAKTKEFLEGDDRREQEIERVVGEVMANRADFNLFSVTGDGLLPENRLDFVKYGKLLHITVDEVSERINWSLAEIAHRILSRDNSFGGLYTSGGDITAAVCKRCGTIGLNMKEEVIPLAACGSFMQGDFPEKLIVTKGGMTGSTDAINICVNKLKAMLNM